MNTEFNFLLKQRWDLRIKLKKAQKQLLHEQERLLEILIKKTKKLNNV
jgi:hypothetical protein